MLYNVSSCFHDIWSLLKSLKSNKNYPKSKLNFRGPWVIKEWSDRLKIFHDCILNTILPPPWVWNGFDDRNTFRKLILNFGWKKQKWWFSIEKDRKFKIFKLIIQIHIILNLYIDFHTYHCKFRYVLDIKTKYFKNTYFLKKIDVRNV